MVTKKIRKGYKQTEVGIIPEEWDVIEIHDCADVVTGSKNTQDRINDGKFPFFVRSQQIERINSCSYDGEAVLTAGDGEVGKIFHYINGKFDFHQRVYMINNFDDRLDGYFFYLYFSKYFIDRITSLTAKSTVDSVRMDMITHMLIPLPKKKEQINITSSIKITIELIDTLDKLIEKKKNIKKGAMQELLSGKRRLEGFDDEWVEKTLGDITIDIRDGTHQTPTYVLSGIPFYSVENITADDFHNTKHISKKEHKRLTSSFKIEKGDILMTRIGSIGDCKLIDWEVNASFYVSLALLKLRKDVSAKFIEQLTKSNSFKRNAESKSLLWAIPKKINLADISNIVICIPSSKEEQNMIANILSSMEQEIKKLEQTRTKYIKIKNGMMQKLLTGEIRLQ